MHFPPMDFARSIKFEDVRYQHFLQDAKVVEVSLMLQTNKVLFELFCFLTSDTGTDMRTSQLLFNGVLTSKTSFTYLKDYKLADVCFAVWPCLLHSLSLLKWKWMLICNTEKHGLQILGI